MNANGTCGLVQFLAPEIMELFYCYFIFAALLSIIWSFILPTYVTGQQKNTGAHSDSFLPFPSLKEVISAGERPCPQHVNRVSIKLRVAVGSNNVKSAECLAHCLKIQLWLRVCHVSISYFTSNGAEVQNGAEPFTPE